MKIYLYKNNSDVRKMNKQLNLLKQIEKYNLKENCTLENPTIILSNMNVADIISDINYCYIAKFKRYYFVTQVRYCVGNTIELECEIDVLKTAWKQIKGKSFLIDRQENIYSPMIEDTELPVRKDRNYYRKAEKLFDKQWFDKYILITTK